MLRFALALLPAALLAFTMAPDAGAQPKNCPPGLAKKDPPCVPPGLAKKGVTRDSDRYEDRDVYVVIDGRIYRVGERLDDRDIIIISDRDLRRLPPLRDGHTYVRIDNQVVEVVEATNLMVRALGAWNDLLN